MALIQTALFLAMVSVSTSIDLGSITIPSLPALPSTLLLDYGPDVAKNAYDAFDTVKDTVDDLNNKIQAVIPALEAAGTEGPKIIQAIVDLVGTLTTTDFSSPLVACYLSKAAYPLAKELVKLLDDIKGLNIPEVNDLLIPLKTFKTSIGLIRCPVAAQECAEEALGSLGSLNPFGRK